MGPIDRDAIRRCPQDLKDRSNRHERPVKSGSDEREDVREKPWGMGSAALGRPDDADPSACP